MIKKILHSTISKIIIGFVVIIAVNEPLLGLLSYFFRLGQVIPIVRYTVIPIIIITFILTSYIVIYRYLEKRKITEISTHNIGKYLLFGLLLGLLVPSLSILVAYLRGEYIILSISNLTDIFLRDLTISIGFGIAGAVFEEVLFRGVLFRLIEEKLGSYIALIISSLIFGFLHLMNGNGSLFAGVAISIISIILTAAYMYTRNLWFPIAIHFAWNFAERDIFGTVVSGGDPVSTSIIVSQLEGSEWFTGGAWGIEASVQIVVFSLMERIILLVLSHRKGNIIKQQVFKIKTE
jgi:membrane protease YdiL (CAAX protease family)